MSVPYSLPSSFADSKNRVALFSLGFRPFFLVAGLFSILLMALFVVGLMGGVWHHSYFPLSLWHAHEMIFGYTAAVIAGFLLTAVRNWTGMDTATGNGLMLLLIIWLAGRFVLVIPVLPGWVIAAIDMSFLPLLALVILRPILKSGQKRNVPVPLILLLMAVGNALIYAEMIELSFGSIEQGLIIGVASVLMLMSVIGGRVMPFFTKRGLPGVVTVSWRWIELAATPSIALWLLFELMAPNSIWGVLAAFVAAAVHGIRLSGWGGMQIWKEPMLWVIQVAYGWLVVGFLLRGFAELEVIPVAIAMHGWTVGAIGMFTYGMMARVALGHTGRAVAADPFMIAGFIFLAMSAVVRVFVPILFPVIADAALLIAAAGWVIAFVLFVCVYTPFLIRPRIDGKLG